MANKNNQATKTNRFVFTIEKDIEVLKCSLQYNPWQLGKAKWTEMLTELQEKFNWQITERTLKSRISLLVEKYDNEQLSFKTGSEEQKSERGILLEHIKALIEDTNASINIEFNADTDNAFLNETDVENTVVIDGTQTTDLSAKQVDPLKPSRKELEDAQREREVALKKFSEDAVPEPTSSRRKRMKFSPEDELIKLKQEHDMKMEEQKLNLEKEKIKTELLLEKERLALEKTRLELECKREDRLEEENKRKDEISSSQLQLQSQMLQLLSNLVKTKD